MQLQQQQQQQLEKSGGIQLGWAKKPMEPRKVKSLAEIQAEEQERLAKVSGKYMRCGYKRTKLMIHEVFSFACRPFRVCRYIGLAIAFHCITSSGLSVFNMAEKTLCAYIFNGI